MTVTRPIYRVLTCIYTNVCTCVHVHVCVLVRVCVHVNIFTHIYKYMFQKSEYVQGKISDIITLIALKFNKSRIIRSNKLERTYNENICKFQKINAHN